MVQWFRLAFLFADCLPEKSRCPAIDGNMRWCLCRFLSSGLTAEPPVISSSAQLAVSVPVAEIMFLIDEALEIFAAIVFVFGLSQILLAARCHLYLRSYETKSARRLRESFDPAVALICPCRGLDPSFEQNVRSMLALNYPSYRIVFAVSDPSDQADGPLRSLTACHPNCQIVISDPVRSPSDKINNLLAAV